MISIMEFAHPSIERLIVQIKFGGILMGSKSRRFVKQSVNAINKHAEKIPYHMTYAEAEARKMRNDKNLP